MPMTSKSHPARNSKRLSWEDVMNWFRTHYEGTEFDMRYGSLAGPWQSPNRAEGGNGAKAAAWLRFLK